MTEVAAVHRYRLRMSWLNRGIRSVLFVVIALCFVPALLNPDMDLGVRVFSLVGVASSVYGLRIILGPAVEVRPEGLRVLKSWPRRRTIPWYRILEIEVVPGYWVLDVELNSGERFSLPCVEHVDDLYEHIQAQRQDLDA
jgi:hypothetical protein